MKSTRMSCDNGMMSRLARIERKCDRALAEIAAIRGTQNPGQKEIDEIVERLHTTSRRLRELAADERCRIRAEFGKH